MLPVCSSAQPSIDDSMTVMAVMASLTSTSPLNMSLACAWDNLISDSSRRMVVRALFRFTDLRWHLGRSR